MREECLFYFILFFYMCLFKAFSKTKFGSLGNYFLLIIYFVRNKFFLGEC